ncbi:Uma2 family endonuclease, partial [Clostridium neonatale]|nr:Uma2 family endonuclease [Clostridium neonatale]
YSGHDYITKLQIYQRYGVLEYVIVEQTGEMIQYNLVDGAFKPSTSEYYISKVFDGLTITNEEILK